MLLIRQSLRAPRQFQCSCVPTYLLLVPRSVLTHTNIPPPNHNNNKIMSVLQQIEAQILPSARIKEYGCPSASVAILSNGVLDTHVFGNSSETPRTTYRADSGSKPITAIAIARLVDKGLLKWDDRIADFAEVESFLHHPESASLLKHVTIQKLLNHTSGLVKKRTCEHPSHAQGFSRNTCLHFSHFPGSKWWYDGDAFALVQIAMEQVCGKPFPELMRELVVEPLGLGRTVCGPLDRKETDYARQHVHSLEYRAGPGLDANEMCTRGMWSTPSDLAKIMFALQQSLRGATSFLRQETARYILIDSAVSMQDTGSRVESLGLGWFVTKSTFGHRGCRVGSGFHCYFFGYYGDDMPGLESTSMAIMTDSLTGEHAMRVIINAVMYMKQWPRQKQLPSNINIDASTPCAAPATTVLDPGWKQWVGEWERDAQHGCKFKLGAWRNELRDAYL